MNIEDVVIGQDVVTDYGVGMVLSIGRRNAWPTVQVRDRVSEIEYEFSPHNVEPWCPCNRCAHKEVQK